MAEKPYLLRCFNTPLEGGNAVIDDFTNIAERVSRRVRRMGGFWSLEWYIPLSEKAGKAYLREWFDDRLMCRIRQLVGGTIVWEGVVWEMELSLNGVKRRRSMADLYNAVKAFYMDHTPEQQETSRYTDDSSIANYGRREFNIYESDLESGRAENLAQRELYENFFPWARPVRFDNEQPQGLSVYAVGDAQTANNKYVAGSHVDDSETNISTFVTEIVQNDCEFLSVGRIETNTYQVTKTLQSPIRAWDALKMLAEMGDTSFNPWRVYVDSGGRLNYEQDDNEPQYEWRFGRGPEGGGLLTDKFGDASPSTYWAMEPAVIRDYTLPKSDTPPNANLQDNRDAWIAEVEMADGLETPNIATDGIDPEEMLRAQQRFQKQLESGVDPAHVAELLARADDILPGDF